MSFISLNALITFDIMIHLNVIHIISEQEDSYGNRHEFSFKYVSKSTGDIISCDRAICTSSNNERRTRNIKMVSGEIRKLRDILFIEFNNEKVCL
jgi:hypothetical protein